MSYNKTKKKKKKFRKNSKYEIKLAQEDLDYLVEKTKFNAEEIVEWHSGFVEDNPGGTLNKIKMMDMYSSVLSIAKATMFVDQIFEKFDKLYVLAEGQTIYRGTTMGLIPFLSSMGLECPSYHNPADFVMEVATGEHGTFTEKQKRAVSSVSCNFDLLLTLAKIKYLNILVHGQKAPKSERHGPFQC